MKSLLIIGLLSLLIGCSEQSSSVGPDMNPVTSRQKPHGKIALTFARALAKGDFDKAHQMLTHKLRVEFPPSRLKARYEQMIAYAGKTAATDVDVLCTMEDW